MSSPANNTTNMPIVVTYREMDKVFNTRMEAVAEATSQSAAETISDPVEAAMMIASLPAALDEIRNAETVPGILASPQHRIAALLQSFMAQMAVQEKHEMVPLPSGGKEAKYDDKDWLGWARSFFTWWRDIVPHAWVMPKPIADTIANTFRIAVLGDWGTGLYGAPVCAASIHNDRAGYDLCLHLGDVYYSGTQEEVNDHFLHLWPQSRLKPSLSRALNSNHEMYTGGHSYFETTLSRFKQGSSCFAFQNDYWVLVGLDSAYQDHDFTNEQVTWLSNIMEKAENRRLVLFSHHQPYSRFDRQGPNLQARLEAFLKSKTIFAWYWGHEHRCTVYDAHPVWGVYGRTIGHGGYPYFRDRVGNLAIEEQTGDARWRRFSAKSLVPGGLILDGPNPYVSGHENEYGPHGYMTLEFTHHRLSETIHAADGTILLRDPYERYRSGS